MGIGPEWEELFSLADIQRVKLLWKRSDSLSCCPPMAGSFFLGGGGGGGIAEVARLAGVFGALRRNARSGCQ